MGAVMQTANNAPPQEPQPPAAAWGGLPAAFQTALSRTTCAADDQTLVAWLFLRVLALIYAAAFLSLSTQIAGLVGQEGILPLREYLAGARADQGVQAYWSIPTVFWINASDVALQVVCLAGMASSAAAFFGMAIRAALVACYVLYLSVTYAGQDFFNFQWDMLLLESGFLAILLVDRTRLVMSLCRFLLFRFMFMGGVVKLWSQEPTWRDMTALQFHLETQPLPSPLAWYAHQLPEFSLQAMTLLVLVIELVIPFFVFLARPYRLAAGAGFLALQGSIMLTGNFAFFNLLTVALCLFVLEDRDLRPLLSAGLVGRVVAAARPPTAHARQAAAAMAAVVLLTCVSLTWYSNMHRPPPHPLAVLLRVTSTLGIVNGYGPFAVMNKERHEIVVEGSQDGLTWMPYEFRYKPGEVKKPLGWNIPHQPRLDWQMWFAALGEPARNAWFTRFLDRLRQGSPPVLSLLERHPFTDKPPAFLRARLYRYRYATPTERAASGQIWERELLGDFDHARSR